MPDIISQPFTGPMTWMARTMLPNDGLVAIDGAALDELRLAAADLEANPLPIEALVPDDQPMPACRALMARVREQLESGIGFAILDRVPLDDIGEEAGKKLYWLLMSMLGPPVAQSWSGSLVYDVTDTGKKAVAGNGVRSSKTNAEQGYHTDNAFNTPPNYVGLFCLQPAMQGGVSGLVSFETVYNRVLERHPEVVPRLYQPFYWDRQMEHAPGDQRFSLRPVIVGEGATVGVNFASWIMKQGYDVAGASMDPATKAAFDAFSEATEEPGFGKEFAFARGQIQIVNNRRIGHRRTGFVDWPDGQKKRHLVRLWVRTKGRRTYHG